VWQEGVKFVTLPANDLELRPVNVISASAGTGKTYRLSHEYVRGLQLASEQDLGGGIIATTFTNKAADELVERVRRVLLDNGKWQEAQEVLSGYLGTVNSICGRLLSEHAIDVGYSPDLMVISEDRLDAFFAIAVDSVMHLFADELHESAGRLQKEDWRDDVRRIIDIARNNNIGKSSFESFAQSCWSRLESLLQPVNPEETAEILDRRLAEAVETALNELEAVHDPTSSAREAADYLKEVNRRIKSGHLLIWQAWVKLEKLRPTNGTREILRRLSRVAAAHARHPRLHEDLRKLIFGVFACAKEALQEYANFKQDHGLIDFVDQEHLALRMLQQPDVRDFFKEKASALLVDEFQDTSPIQLAVFLEMAQLVKYSVWVGDEKQSIFGFRGSDPDLMRQAVAKLVSVTGGSTEQLVKSYRSRPSLVGFTNALFSRCTKLMQIDAEGIVVEETDRTELSEQNHPLHLWWLEPPRREQQLETIAASVAEMLARPDQWMVLDRKTKQLRPIRGSDVAILCRTNASRLAAAKALAAAGLTVATERDSLLDTPECVLAIAALRVLVDQTDSLAVAEIVNILDEENQGGWLKNWISNGRDATEAELPQLATLRAARSDLNDRTPCEVLELAIIHGGILDFVVRWGNPRQRLANLDALRGLGRTYEEVCRSARTPATPAGLVMHLHRNIASGGNQPANPDENGIHVLTYHKAKGLEWPLVILYDLDYSLPGTAFGTVVEQPPGSLDPLKPLAGRSIRYWPWPYGQTKKDVQLMNAAARTREAAAARHNATAESARLLYVAMTRARDYLIMTCSRTGSGTAWLDTLRDHEEEKILHLSCNETPVVEEIIATVPASLAHLQVKSPPDRSVEPIQVSLPVYGSPDSNEIPDFKPYYLRPSEASELELGAASAAERSILLTNGSTEAALIDSHAGMDNPQILQLGERLQLTGSPDMQVLGDCVHSFLAVDNVELPLERRLAMGNQILKNWKVDNLRGEDLVASGDRLIAFIAAQFPGAVLLKEFPITGRLSTQRVRGSIDLLVETPAGFIIIDHKSFPGKSEDWATRAMSHLPQLHVYKHVLQERTGKIVKELYIHMPIVGAMIKVG
jgi:ATP-dependent exoDNAse (exonuclease V) beta subunit